MPLSPPLPTLSLLPPPSTTMSTADLGEVRPEYTLSSNPPNPKTSFRLGDWICPSPKCAAHNFGRNLSCIGCGSPRSPTSSASSTSLSTTNICRPSLASPRFTAAPSAPSSAPAPVTTTYYSSGGPQPSPPLSAPTTSSPPLLSSSNAANNKSPHPLLTPSGRAFAVGGKVQNISSDPLNPCVMYWPDNEPIPDQGQIRPSGLVGIPQPPILNTGNRGPISHQPGDWICLKCNYLNWRRRKVCQTCLPYAEGNGDSISAAVQAERIALLTNVLAQTRLDPSGSLQVPINIHPPTAPVSAPGAQLGSGQSPFTPLQNLPNVQQQAQAPSSHCQTPPHVNERRAFLDVPFPHQQSHSALLNPLGHGGANRTVHRSQSHFALGQQYTQAQAAVAAVAAMQAQQHLGAGLHQQRRLAPSPASAPIYQTPLPSHQHQQQPVSQTIQPIPTHVYPQQQQQRSIQRNPSPLPSVGTPLLYATGPSGSTGMFMNGGGLSAGFGAAGHGRARVLSSPAGPVGMGGAGGFGDGGGGGLVYGTGPYMGHQTAIQSQTHFREQRRGSEELSISKSAAGTGTTAGDNDDVHGASNTTDETLTTPASATPLLPAFLQDIVLKDAAGVSATCDADDEEVLNGQKGISGCTPVVRLIGDDGDNMRYPASMMPLGGGGTATPVPGFKYAPSIIGTGDAPTAAAVQTPGSNAHMVHPRARNDSGSSTTSSSFSTSISDSESTTSTSTSTSLLSLPLSGSPPSSAACTPTNNASTTTPNNTNNTTSVGNPAGSNSSSGSSSTGLYNFNLGIGVVSGVGGIGGGIWRMDGNESRNLGWAGSTSGSSSSSSSSSSLKGLGQGYLHGNAATTTCAMAVQLPVGAERKGI